MMDTKVPWLRDPDAPQPDQADQRSPNQYWSDKAADYEEEALELDRDVVIELIAHSEDARIRFFSPPSPQVVKELKEAGFRWRREHWYGPASQLSARFGVL